MGENKNKKQIKKKVFCLHTETHMLLISLNFMHYPCKIIKNKRNNKLRAFWPLFTSIFMIPTYFILSLLHSQSLFLSDH